MDARGGGPVSLDIDARHGVGAFALDVSLRLEGPVTGLFGPSGAGKTTLLNIIAGLIRPEAGRVSIDGETWFDADRKLFTPPRARRIGYVFQEGRLFPHLSVRQNLIYGRFFAAAGGAGPTRLEEVVDLLGIGSLLSRRPATLSGGEQQRVAIGRALLRNPRLLLMDEPLAALDAARRADILPYIENLRDRFAVPIVYVSHSIEEVERLANEIVVLAGGTVTSFRGGLSR